MFKVKKEHQNDVNDVVLVSVLLTWIYFTPFSNISVVEFEQVNVARLGAVTSQPKRVIFEIFRIYRGSLPLWFSIKQLEIIFMR